MSHNEFDDLPDDFAAIHDVDWAQILGPTPPSTATTHAPASTHPGPEPSAPLNSPAISSIPESNDSSMYFSDDMEMDAAFLAELDRLEETLIRTGSMAPSASTSGPPRAIEAQNITSSSFEQNFRTVTPMTQSNQTSEEQGQSHQPQNASIASSTQDVNITLKRNGEHVSDIPNKRPRLSDSSHPITLRSKGKEKAADNLQLILSAYEEELTCPICCDLFVASHVGNPCGHNFCGDCGWKWHQNIQNVNKGCPCCRKTLDVTTPMIPNIFMDNIVEKHVLALALSGMKEWETSGQKYKEWNARKTAWRNGAGKKSKTILPQRSRSIISMSTIQVFDAPESWLNHDDNVEEDPTYEDSDVELIPRPTHTARQRRGRAR